jgi:hypothetical protein
MRALPVTRKGETLPFVGPRKPVRERMPAPALYSVARVRALYRLGGNH